MTWNTADRLAVAEELADWISKHRPTLAKAGLNVDLFFTNLTQAIAAFKAANTTQEMMKATLKNQTQMVVDADKTMYSFVTSYIDVIGGVYGKNSNEAKQLRRLRSQLHRPTPPKPAA